MEMSPGVVAEAEFSQMETVLSGNPCILIRMEDNHMIEDEKLSGLLLGVDPVLVASPSADTDTDDTDGDDTDGGDGDGGDGDGDGTDDDLPVA